MLLFNLLCYYENIYVSNSLLCRQIERDNRRNSVSTVLGPLCDLGKSLSTREGGIIGAVDAGMLLMRERTVQPILLVDVQMIFWNVEGRQGGVKRFVGGKVGYIPKL